MSDQEIKSIVEGWNWNASIFDIYDEIRDWKSDDQEKVLAECIRFFANEDGNPDRQLQPDYTSGGFKDLAYHLNVEA